MTEEIPALADELRRLLGQLRDLLPERVADATRGTTSHHRIHGSPAPWHPEAGPVLMTIHAGVRELEADLRYHITGHTGPGRGGSDGNTAAALDSIVRLAHGVPEDVAADAARRMSGWVEAAKKIRDIGESERWIPIHVPKGQLPPACPYCKTFSLRVAQESGRVRCANPRCVDEQGNRPIGHIDRNRLDGSAMLVWADGRTIYYNPGETP